jgi:hypothetical protein
MTAPPFLYSDTRSSSGNGDHIGNAPDALRTKLKDEINRAETYWAGKEDGYAEGLHAKN